MCGIVGIIDQDLARPRHEAMDRMLAALVHRGPDFTAAEYRPGFALGIRRLSIVDVVHGRQPVWSADGGVVAVLNGEIFNHHALRAELEAHGYVFRTQNDAELIPSLYEHYGVDFVDKLNGQFAIALFDLKARVFHAWRDPMGICPLFYAQPRPGVFIFASEIKAICAFPGFQARLNPLGLDQVITFPGPVSPTTLFAGICALPAGDRVSLAPGGAPKLKRYWRMCFAEEPTGQSGEAWAEQLSALLADAVKLRISDEVPTALYLSGGLDSSLVGAFFPPKPGQVLHAFSVDFDDQLISEGAWQRMMAEFLGAQHHSVTLDPQGICDRLERVVWHTETALRETFNTASLALSEMAALLGIKVALAGQGADELFAGYVGYRFDARSQHAARPAPVPVAEEAAMNQRLWGNSTFTYERRHHQFDAVRQAIYSPHLREEFAGFNSSTLVSLADEVPPHYSVLQRRSAIDLRLRLADHLLAGHGDRMAMANSLEVRYPFLDPRIVQLAGRLPDGLKLHGMREKYLVKQVAKTRLPAPIVEREKFGFTASGSPALLRLQNPRIAYCLSEEKLKRDNVFDVAEVARLVKLYQTEGYRINVPFETDLLITVITYGMLSDRFNMASE